jgi:hypothetical protein
VLESELKGIVVFTKFIALCLYFRESLGIVLMQLSSHAFMRSDFYLTCATTLKVVDTKILWSRHDSGQCSNVSCDDSCAWFRIYLPEAGSTRFGCYTRLCSSASPMQAQQPDCHVNLYHGFVSTDRKFSSDPKLSKSSHLTTLIMGTIYDAVPLDHDRSNTNIRVIEILRRYQADKDEPIACAFHTICLQERHPYRFDLELDDEVEMVPYTALSYTWGPPDEGKYILLNGKPFNVRENLWRFLKEASNRGANASLKDVERERPRSRQPTLFWIDAICIDQSQVEERNHQVAMMGRIYSEASGVLVWLGTASSHLSHLLRQMHCLTVDEDYRLHWYLSHTEWLQAEDSFEELCNKDYWQRLWVVQEYLLARNIVIWCGQENVDPEKLRWLVFVDFNKTKDLSKTYAVELIQGRKVRDAHATRLSLKRHLDDFGTRMKCADVRDRVYGLLSLVNEEELEELNIRPDYSLSVTELFAELYLAFACKRKTEPLSDVLNTLCAVLELEVDDDVIEEISRIVRGSRKMFGYLMRGLLDWRRMCSGFPTHLEEMDYWEDMI